MQKYSNQLEAEVQERTMQLEEEKQKTEDLIAKMLPLIFKVTLKTVSTLTTSFPFGTFFRPVAQALVAGNPVDPEAFDNVTIYFSDIVGFSLISAKSTPLQIVDLLSDIYTAFDALIEKFDVYKIATMALELLSLSDALVIRHLPDVPILLRIGIHSAHCTIMIVCLLNYNGLCNKVCA
ncbi:unnamed protein product [Dibothriocephalus latus]|uniref:Guanylate cyclase domain-containing protein n=1 Tax=Dibothriocephalus latus TaxID=60516 RepID=A0A3P7N3Y7_DIBLA|nr:unnamed protein product [Dibothriocephalus latus]